MFKKNTKEKLFIINKINVKIDNITNKLNI